MNPFSYLRPGSVAQAAALLAEHPGANLLAGGQSLLAAMKLGLCAPSHLIDLQDVPGLADIAVTGDQLWVGAMVPHARVASSSVVRSFEPMLAELAGGIADPQVRQVGTIGGSLANNDPAACWSAGVMAMGAVIVTHLREIHADDYFAGIYSTTLRPGELVVGVRFPRAQAAHYRKHEQPASRFALVGVAVACMAGPDANPVVRVAVTGLGNGVLRWQAAEQALSRHWHTAALDSLAFPVKDATGDVHASAEYRAHLVAVTCRRAMASLTAANAPRPQPNVVTKPDAPSRPPNFFKRIFRRP